MEYEREQTLEVVVDRYDRIQSLSTNWDEVAEQGGAGEQLAQQKVLGQTLAGFIKSDTTRMYIETCLKLCRLRQEVLFREYRCDSPTHRRYMELQLTPLPDGAVSMKHFFLYEVPFEKKVTIKDVSDDTLKQAVANYQYIRCSMCNKLKPLGQEQWFEPDALKVSAQQAINVIHSVCPDCQNKLWSSRPVSK